MMTLSQFAKVCRQHDVSFSVVMGHRSTEAVLVAGNDPKEFYPVLAALHNIVDNSGYRGFYQYGHTGSGDYFEVEVD